MNDQFVDLPDAERADADAVARALTGHGRVGVAFSGGVDSAVLLAVAVRALGRDAAPALLAVSPSLASSERRAAHATADAVGAALVEFATHEGERPEYRANDVDRCFHCKDEMFARISADLVAEHALDAVAYGENADDAVALDRPGARAAQQHAVLRPLATAGLTKARVRSLARALGLAVADKPAAPCLASRIPHGQEVTPEKLRQIEASEQALHEAGFREARVRHHGDIARVEVPLADLGRFTEPGVREGVLTALRAAGFRHITLDLAGLQSGAFTMAVVRARG